MAGFCTNCGSSLADGQAFCTKCGVAAGPVAARPAVPGLSPVSPEAPAPQKSNRTLIKVLLICGAVVLLFGIAGIAGLAYLGYHFKDKIHEMGLDDPRNMQYHGPVLAGVDPCTLLSTEDVSQVVKMAVVRAERTMGGEVGCEYSVMGDADDLITSHIALLNKTQSTASQRREMETMARSFFHSSNRQTGMASAPRHPGEAPVFIFIVDNNAAKMQMGITRTAFGRISPGTLTNLNDVGEDAFDMGNALIMVRQGDNLVRVMYMSCPCTQDDALPLVRKIVASISEQ
jgi:zinc-ribbon domain